MGEVAFGVTVALLGAAALAFLRWWKPLSDRIVGDHPDRLDRDGYDALDEHYRTVAAFLQPDDECDDECWDAADQIAYERAVAAYRWDGRLPGERAG